MASRLALHLKRIVPATATLHARPRGYLRRFTGRDARSVFLAAQDLVAAPCEHNAAVWLAKRCDVATDDIRPDSESTSVQVNSRGFSVRLHTDKQQQHLLRSRGV